MDPLQDPSIAQQLSQLNLENALYANSQGGGSQGPSWAQISAAAPYGTSNTAALINALMGTPAQSLNNTSNQDYLNTTLAAGSY
jgi:hypothetical protein